MLRPKKMSKVSVAGSKGVLEDAVEVLHELNLVHVTDYDGSWEGFENGNPLEGGEEVSGKLVQVRAVMNTLGVEEDDYDEEEGTGFSTREELYDRLADLRERVNELEDDRNRIRDGLRDAREERRTLEPFVRLGIDIDLLKGHDEIELRVGLGDAEEVRGALEEADGDEYEVFGGDGVVAVASRDIDTDDVLVGVDFSEIDVPDGEGEPADLIDEVENRVETLEGELNGVESRIESLRDEHANFLLAAEEELSIEAQKTDAPLRFATTTNSFYAEGWMPTESYTDMVDRLQEAVGDRVDVRELETVEYNDEGHPEEHASEDDEDEENGNIDDPPVVQDNPGAAKPFEPLVNTINRPKYTELDPTIVVFLTFPFAFGFMIGDMGYGVLYVLMGYAVYKAVDSETLKALGVIGIWSGVFTFIFGYLYDDIFGIHPRGDLGIDFLIGAGVLSKGIQVEQTALMWLVASILFGIIHLNVAHIFGFINDLSHSVKEAVVENASWLLVLNGFFAWVFSLHLAESKPAFLVGEEAVLNENPMFSLGFTGLPEEVGIAMGVVAVVGFVMVVYGEGAIGAIETPTNAFGHVLSYLRIMAVLIAKGGMAFVVNVLVFGAYETEHPYQEGDSYIQFALTAPPSELVSEGQEVAFGGLVWMGLGEGTGVVLMVVGLLAAVAVFVLGHIIVLLLGITAAGIQMVRLEYVEFFGKFYEGGGDKFEPFGKPRKYTKEGR